MNFNAPEFPLFFLAIFALHWLLPHRFRWIALLLGSWLYFHWNLRAGPLLLAVTLVSWLCAGGIAGSESAALRRALLILALLATLGCLGIFKYAGFFASLAGLDLPLQIILPVGISFYTFQSLGYVLDVHRGRTEPERHFGYYALFIAFFPQLVAGPIERTENLLPQLKARRVLTRADLSAGLWLLVQGYFKKLLIADRLAPLVDPVYAAPGNASGPEVILATVLFGLQIYCDFSGYSDIARGTAKLLGIDLMENFRRPYLASSVREFWRRWHISLTGWFTDYVYIPLGGSRRGLLRQVRNILAVFLLGGLWHGAGWTFVLWGLLHGLYLACGAVYQRLRPDRPAPGRARTLWSHVRTVVLVTIPWLFFRAGRPEDAILLLSRISAGWGSLPTALFGAFPALLPVLCLPLAEHLADRGREELTPSSALTLFCCVTAITLGWLSQLCGGGQNAFLYFQF